MEIMVGERLNYIAESKNLLSEFQHGSRFRRNTMDHINELEHEIRTLPVGDKPSLIFPKYTMRSFGSTAPLAQW